MARRLLLLNGIAIVCVILFHATGFGFTAMFSWAHRYRHVVSPNYDEIGTVAYYALRLVEQFVVVAIPSFLFVSGFFVSVLVGRGKQTIEGRAIWGRIRHLAIPYLLWTFVVLVAFAIEGRVFPWTRYVAMILTGSSNPNYYYVPLLIQLYLVAPVLVILARRNWKALLAVTGALQLVVYFLQYVIVLNVQIPVATTLATLLPKWFFPVHLFWFTCGVVAGFNQVAFREWLGRIRWALPAAVVAFYLLGVIEWELLLKWSGSPWMENRITLIDGLYAGSMIFSFLAFSEVEIPFAMSLVELGGRSYGIYLVHGLVMEYFARGLYHVAPWVLGQQALFQPMLILLGLTVPVILMGLVNRSPSRKLYSYVFG